MKAQDQDIEIRRATIGKFLRERRLSRGLTQSEVAKLLNYSSSQFISNWECGTSQPPLNVFPHLAYHYEINPDEFVQAFSELQEKLLGQYRETLIASFK